MKKLTMAEIYNTLNSIDRNEVMLTAAQTIDDLKVRVRNEIWKDSLNPTDRQAKKILSDMLSGDVLYPILRRPWFEVIDGCKRQIISDGYRAYCFILPVKDLPKLEVPEEKTPPKFEPLFKKAEKDCRCPVEDISTHHLKLLVETQKAKLGKDARIVQKLGPLDVGYNAQYLYEMLMVLPKGRVYVDAENPRSFAYVWANNGMGILLPCAIGKIK